MDAPKLKIINSFGTGTSRYVGGLPHPSDENVLDIACGSCVARWDIKEKKRLHLLKDHSSLVTGMLRFGPYVLTVSFSGEVFLRDSESWKVLSKASAERGHVMHVSVDKSGKKIAINSEVDDKSCFTTFKIENNQLIYEATVHGIYEFPEFIDSDTIVAVRQQHEDTQQPQKNDTPKQKQKIPPQVVVLKLSARNSSPAVYNVVLTRDLPDHVEIAMIDDTRQIYALAYHDGRKIEVISTQNLESLWNFAAPGTGLIIDLLFYVEQSSTNTSPETTLLLVPSSNGNCTVWKKDKQVNNIKLPSGQIRFVDWAVPHERMWVVTDSGVHSVQLNSQNSKPSDYELSYHQLSCCGVAIHPKGKLVGVGDLLSQVIIWDIDSGLIKHQTMVGMSVRSLCWHPSGSSILIGCMDGSIFQWNFKENENGCEPEGEPTPIASLVGGITCIKWENGENPSKFAAGTTEGTLAVIEKNPGEISRFHIAFKAHKPSSEFNDQFGSLTKFAEVWSLTWLDILPSKKKSDFRIATASEDQTICIWNSHGDCLHVLQGHTTAVTSVDYRITPIGPVLASCADDRTIRIWKENVDTHTFDLFHIFETKHIADWHTVTYLSIQDNGPHVVCTTQNGYIFVFNFSEKKEVVFQRMHQGSVEGVLWDEKNKMIVSCSSDCTVNVYRFE